MSIKPTASFMKAAGLLAFLSLTPFSIYLMYNRSGGPESQKEMTFQKNLRYAFMAESNAIDLAPLTAWPWVRVCAVDAGVTREEFKKIIGFDYKNYDEMHWLPLKTHWSLVFIDYEREASWGVKGVCVPRETARLVFARGAAPVGASPIMAELKHAPVLTSSETENKPSTP